jgi:hypothetical protein
MLVNDLELYGSWNLELPATPERSKLYYLEPIAIDTPYVEGLVSYICRLAEAHCVSPGVLIKQEILPSFREIYSVGPQEIYETRKCGNVVSVSSHPKPAYHKNPNNQGFFAWQYVEGLKPLTLRENLQSLIIPAWIDKNLQMDLWIELARQVRAWCPECFQVWRDSEQPIYEPLLWSIAAVTICPYHHQPLQSLCPHCQQTQPPLAGKMQVARCSNCMGWLNVQPEKPSEAELLISTQSDWHLWVVERVIEVLAAPSSIPAIETREAIARVIYDSEKPHPIIATDELGQSVQGKLLEVFANGTIGG